MIQHDINDIWNMPYSKPCHVFRQSQIHGNQTCTKNEGHGVEKENNPTVLLFLPETVGRTTCRWNLEWRWTWLFSEVNVASVFPFSTSKKLRVEVQLWIYAPTWLYMHKYYIYTYIYIYISLQTVAPYEQASQFMTGLYHVVSLASVLCTTILRSRSITARFLCWIEGFHPEPCELDIPWHTYYWFQGCWKRTNIMPGFLFSSWLNWLTGEVALLCVQVSRSISPGNIGGIAQIRHTCSKLQNWWSGPQINQEIGWMFYTDIKSSGQK